MAARRGKAGAATAQEEGEVRKPVEPTLARMRPFLAVAKQGSVVQVAPKDPAEQSHISRLLGELERALGGRPLLRKIGTSRQLTEDGEAFFAVAAPFVQEVDRLRGEADKREVVRLVAPDSMLRWLVLPKVTGPATRADAFELSMSAASDPALDLLSYKADVALGQAHSLFSGKDLATVRVGLVSFGLFVPSALAARDATESLPAVRVIGVGELQRRAEQAAPRKLRFLMQVETYAQAARAVATGQVVAVMPEQAQQELTPMGTACLRIDGIADDLLLMARKGRLREQALKAAFAFLERNLGKPARARR